MKKISFVLVILLALSVFSGCLGPVSLDSYGYAIAVGIDVGKQKKYNIFFLFQRERMGTESASESEGSALVGVEGDSIYEAIALVEAGMPYKINLSRTVFFMFSEEIARQGLMEDFLFLSFNSLKLRYSINTMVVAEDIEAYMDGLTMESVPNIAKLQYNLIDPTKDSNWIPTSTVTDIEESTLSERFDLAMPYGIYDESIITAKQKQEAEKSGEEPKPNEEDTTAGVERVGGMRSGVYGSAIFDGWNMVGVLPGEDTSFMLMANGQYSDGTVSFIDRKGCSVSVYLIEERKPRVIISLYPKPVATVSMRFSCSLDYDSSSSLELRVKDVQEDLAQYLQSQIARVFKSCQQLNSDCFGFGRAASKRFYNTKEWEAYAWKSNHYKDLEANFIVEIDMENQVSGME